MRRIARLVRRVPRSLLVHLWTAKVTRKANTHGYVRVNGPGTLIDGQHLRLGSNVHFAGFFYINAKGGVRIGDNCHISRNFTLYSCNHNYKGNALPYDETHILSAVTIEDNVWVGMNVSITPGVKIGEGAIVGLGSVVTKDVPRLAVVGGNPANVLKYRDSEHYERVLRKGYFGGANGRLVIAGSKVSEQ